MRAKSKMKDAKLATRFSNRGKIRIPELEGYYFGHGDERSGTRFNRAVEKLADYARIEYGLDMFYHTGWHQTRVGRDPHTIRKGIGGTDEEV